MPEYNFLNLSPFDFENLTRDVLQEHYDINLESFTTGRDKGIDLRYSKNSKNILIVQCKSYNNYNSLKSNLKKEYQKTKTLNPQKYILSTSVGLTPLNKDEIIKIFNGYIKSPSDIFGKDDLNNLLGQYPEIEKKHFKLWLSSTNILQKLLHNDIISRSEFEEEKIRKEINIYVQNDSFYDAINILDHHNYVLISGIPGIGKTILARILIFNYLLKDYELVVVSSDINEAESLYERGKKQLFYYDDFLGSNFLEERLKKNEDRRLIRFIERIKNSSNKKLIMTTREYILNQAKLKYEKFEDLNLEITKCIIDLEKYSKLIRAEILYNHLFYSNLPHGYIHVLLIDKSYLKIIDHPNYNPRIIEIMTDKDGMGRISERGFFDFFIKNLNNPINIWKHSFENQISKSSRYLLYIMLVSNDQIFEDDLEKSFWKLYKNESNKLNFEINREDFINSLKELENTFIKISKVQSDRSYGLEKKNKTKNLIQFQNPSIRDFLINKVRNTITLISSLIDSAIYLNQLFDIYRIYSENKSYKILLDDDLVSKLINNIIQKFDNLESIKMHRYYENGNKYYWEAEKLSNIQKLYDLASFFNLKEFPKIAKFIITRLSQLENENSIKYFDENILLDILVILKKYCNFKYKKYIEKYFISVENMDDISNLIKIKNNFPKIFKKLFNEDRDIEEIKEKIIEVVNNEFDTVCNGEEIDFGVVEELKSNLEEFEENFEIDFDFQDLIINLENIMAEDPSNYDPGDYLEDEYPRNYSHNNEEKIIEDMFDSLK
jgi:hypothetical protein